MQRLTAKCTKPVHSSTWGLGPDLQKKILRRP